MQIDRGRRHVVEARKFRVADDSYDFVDLLLAVETEVLANRVRPGEIALRQILTDDRHGRPAFVACDEISPSDLGDPECFEVSWRHPVQ